jgi:hypothetical protein
MGKIFFKESITLNTYLHGELFLPFATVYLMGSLMVLDESGYFHECVTYGERIATIPVPISYFQIK